ncbi:MAG: hypothetical protein JWN74_1728 [Acidobacteriaceae bacterium]|nr:hypothetical protein [Acidobacteriaceae bacterium]
MRRGFKRSWCASFVVLLLLSLSSAQSQGPSSSSSSPSQAVSGSEDSLAAVVRRAKVQKDGHSKKVITDDDLQSGLGPLPRLKTDEAENGEDVIAAIAKYKQSHSPEQTETVVRRWYNEYDTELAAAIKNNLETKEVRGASVNNAYEVCQNEQDYSECRRRQVAEAKGARYDQADIARTGQWIVRLQHSLSNVRNRLLQMGFRYDWFKVRTTNNIDRF